MKKGTSTRHGKAKSGKTHSSYLTFELHTLGWKAFQSLCLTIAKECMGQTVQTFNDSHDGGRDGAFHGTWSPKKKETFSGAFTIQCKFTAKSDHTISVKDLAEEFKKAALLAQRDVCDTYILFTNRSVTAATELEIKSALLKIPRIQHAAVFGLEWITHTIRESPKLRMLVPRIYGLGDLSLIMDARAQEQAQEILKSLGEDLRKFIITDAYKRSSAALVEHGFVLLLGEPACGKSSIAAALAMSAIDNWQCQTFKITSANDFKSHFNPHEPNQFFWVDDAFGATQCESTRVSDWNQALPLISAAIHRGAKILFTSRDYIYKAAKYILKESSIPIMKESQVVIHVEKITAHEREQILYNHIRLGRQSRAYRTKLKPLLPAVAHHKNFSPEIARRLGDPMFTRKLDVSPHGLLQFVEHPVEWLRDILLQLDSDCRASLALIFMRNGTLSSPIKIATNEQTAIDLLSGTPAGIRTALNHMKESLVVLDESKGAFFWRYKHPTIRDAFAGFVAEDRELMDIYLAGVPLTTLVSEVICGNVKIQGAKVIVPSDRYAAVRERLHSHLQGTYVGNGHVVGFLRHRCGKEFLTEFIAENPDFAERLLFHSTLAHCGGALLFARLHEYRLVTEPVRAAKVARIQEIGLETPDAGCLDEPLRSLFTETELVDFLHNLKNEVIPRLSDEVDNWKDNYAQQPDWLEPVDYFDDLRTTISRYEDEFSGDPAVIKIIEKSVRKIDTVTTDLNSDREEKKPQAAFPNSSSSEEPSQHVDTIYDDVDD